jgi:hypothetical protein
MVLVIDTLSGKSLCENEMRTRTTSTQNCLPIMTTLCGSEAAMKAIKSLEANNAGVRALQEYHQ